VREKGRKESQVGEKVSGPLMIISPYFLAAATDTLPFARAWMAQGRSLARAVANCKRKLVASPKVATKSSSAECVEHALRHRTIAEEAAKKDRENQGRTRVSPAREQIILPRGRISHFVANFYQNLFQPRFLPARLMTLPQYPPVPQ
jgi:hypothetical protein